ncbi:hypothetical protein RFI_30191, partial [Reticulomyxa filosa]
MIFFIEIPSKLDMFPDTLHNFFYTLCYKTSFSNETKPPPFRIGDKGHFSIKWMEEFYSGKLKQRNFVINIFKNLKQTITMPLDIDVENKPKLSPTAIKEFMRKHFSRLTPSSPWHYFNVLANSQFLLDNCIPFRHDVTKCAIALATDLCLECYNESDSKTVYRPQFNWCEKVETIKRNTYFYFVFLIDRKTGSISLLAATTEQLKDKRLDPLKRIDCPVIAWEEVNNVWSDQQKKERINFLFRAVDVPKEKRSEIQKLCDKNFEHYVLTYDNILKMLAILLKIRSNLPVYVYSIDTIALTTTIKKNVYFRIYANCLKQIDKQYNTKNRGCGKTALIKYLACAVDVHLEAVDIHGGIERTHIRDI